MSWRITATYTPAFPASPANGQIYSDPNTGFSWIYSSGTGQWTDMGAMQLIYNTNFATTTIIVPFVGEHNITIYWGDGLTDSYTYVGTDTQTRSHTYAAHGIYTVLVTGTAVTYGTTNTAPRAALTRCLSYGNLGLTSLFGSFKDCPNLLEVPAILPSNITNTNSMFSNATNFNQDISGWNMSNVTTTNGMFNGATNFNQDISGWDMSSVNDTGSMFSGATNFNQDIGGWDMSNVSGTGGMFNGATSFNQDIGGWDMSKVSLTRDMFRNATQFNQDIGSWNTSNMNNSNNMFNGATNFNQDLTGWCVGNFLSAPSNFATGSALTPGNLPVWGTCPNYIPDGAITFVGTAEGATSATLPPHQAGDFIFAFGFSAGSTTAITMPTDWLSMGSTSNNGNYIRFASKAATSSSETSGEWTGATRMIFAVYRNAEISGRTLAGLRTGTGGSSTSVTYGTNNIWPNLAQTISFMAHVATDQANSVVPTGITSRLDNNVGCRMFIGDSSGSTTGFTTQTISVGGTSSGWYTFTFRLRNKIVKV